MKKLVLVILNLLWLLKCGLFTLMVSQDNSLHAQKGHVIFARHGHCHVSKLAGAHAVSQLTVQSVATFVF